jgi:hypothetical protein
MILHWRLVSSSGRLLEANVEVVSERVTGSISLEESNEKEKKLGICGRRKENKREQRRKKRLKRYIFSCDRSR